MIGPACSTIAFVTAWLVARREPRHGPIRDALGCALLHAGCYALGGNERNPRAMLALFALVALASGWAYLKAWDWDVGHAFGLPMMCFLLWCFGAGRPGAWTLATWGPFVLSSAVGAWALFRSFGVHVRERDGEDWFAFFPYEWTFTQRIALVLLVSDVCMLLFAAIGASVAQVWQGRVSALVVTGMQCSWLVRRFREGAFWVRYKTLRANGNGRLFSAKVARMLMLLPVTSRPDVEERFAQALNELRKDK